MFALNCRLRGVFACVDTVSKVVLVILAPMSPTSLGLPLPMRAEPLNPGLQLVEGKSLYGLVLWVPSCPSRTAGLKHWSSEKICPTALRSLTRKFFCNEFDPDAIKPPLRLSRIGKGAWWVGLAGRAGALG
jgi:hypothetical protein